ncbi:MAG: glycosyltransferase family 2 protein [Desulfovibrionales bacterium]|nr:glycosyltransferase family 2 protein [Desulfovibrionales bacterium]
MSVVPKISVIMPCYNVEKYIARAIESVLQQTFIDFEFLIIIDGSPDNSQKIAESYAQKDKRIKVVVKENGGVSSARNMGLDNAKGEYIYFIDPDDWIEPSLLEDNIHLLIKENSDVVLFALFKDRLDKYENLLLSEPIIFENLELTKYSVEELSYFQIGVMGYTWNKIIKIAVVEDNYIRFDETVSFWEDAVFNYKVFSKVSKIVFNGCPYYHYNLRPIQSLSKKSYPYLFDSIKSRCESLNLFLSTWCINNKDELIAQVVINDLRICIGYLFRFSDKNKKSKLAEIEKIINEPLVREYLIYFSPKDFKGISYKFLLKYKQRLLIYYLVQLNLKTKASFFGLACLILIKTLL